MFEYIDGYGEVHTGWSFWWRLVVFTLYEGTLWLAALVVAVPLSPLLVFGAWLAVKEMPGARSGP